jgi:hypothetical protein
MPFEPAIPLVLNGSIAPTLIQDPDALPTTIIKSTDPFKIEVNWNLNGSGMTVMDGTFHVTAFFEHIGVDVPGGAQDANFGPKNVAFSAGVGGAVNKNYKALIDVPAGAVKAGAYDLVCLLTFTNVFNQPGNIAASTDEIVVQIYDPNPAMP